MSSRVGRFGGTGLFDVGVVVCGLFSLRRVSTNDCFSLRSDANLDIEFIGRHGLRTVKFILPNRGFTRRLCVYGLCQRGISGSEDEITGRGRTIAVVSRRDLDGIASHS